MARPQPKFSEEQKNEIMTALKCEKSKTGYLKLMVLKYKAIDGLDSIATGKITGYHPVCVNQMVSRYRRYGLEATIKRPVTRNRAYMTVEEEKAFLLPFKERAERGQILEVSEIAQALNEALGHSVSLYMVYDLLKRHQWRKIMPRSKHPQKASEEAIVAYKKNQ